MKTRILFALASLGFSAGAIANTTEMTGNPLVDGILSTILYSGIGIVMAVLAFKIADWLTPGNLREQIAEHENRALATVTGAMIIGVCIIIAAVMIG